VPLSFALNAPGSDRAHTFLAGVTGSGKSSALSFFAAQFMRYPGARVVVFDRGRSFMVACLALGGDWIELGGGGKGVQPLRAIDRPEELAWAHGWVMRALKLRGLATTPQTEAAVGEALRHVAERPPGERTLSLLHAMLAANDDARQTLGHYLAGGPYGDLFDGVVDSYGEAAVVGVETRDIVQLEDAAPLAVTAMFRALQRDRLVGDAPKLVIVDEAWSLLGHPLFAAELQSWAREMRKLKAVLVLATQSLLDLQEGPARVIADQIGNRIYLPHAEAMRPQSRALYEAAGLTEEQIALLTVASPKGEYLLQTEELTRLVGLRLEGDALRLCGASSPGDIARAKAMLAEGVRPGEEFTRLWLEMTTAEWLAEQGVATLHAAE
jgi:type IV secretion system protein VirB4